MTGYELSCEMLMLLLASDPLEVYMGVPMIGSNE